MNANAMNQFDQIAVNKGWQKEKGKVLSESDQIIIDRLNQIERAHSLFNLNQMTKKNGQLTAILRMVGDHPLDEDFSIETWKPTISINGGDRPLHFKFNSINEAIAFIDQFSHHQFD